MANSSRLLVIGLAALIVRAAIVLRRVGFAAGRALSLALGAGGAASALGVVVALFARS